MGFQQIEINHRSRNRDYIQIITLITSVNKSFKWKLAALVNFHFLVVRELDWVAPRLAHSFILPRLFK